MKLPYRKAESLACLLLILTSALAALAFLPKVEAQTAVTSMTPVAGNVGTTVYLTANLTTPNGTFQILWDNSILISNATAVGNNVTASFVAPPSTSGNHVVTLTDITKSENATTNFTVYTAYSLNVSPQPAPPAQSQEGDIFNFTLSMTGGDQGMTNVANITIAAPNSASYTSLGNITTGDDGNGTLNVNFPGDFSSGANTNFTGQYGIFFNGTLAQAAFSVELTNSSEYHRDQTLDVKAAYTPNENVTLAITGNDMNHYESLTADVTGIVHYVSSTILSNASIGVYTVNLTSVSGPMQKVPPDVQTFTVPGFPVNITTRNLAEEPVQNVLVSVFENLISVSNLTSDATGLVTLNLEIGNYLCNASYGGQDVGMLAIAVNETNTTFELQCNLTNLIVVVADEDGVLIPDVELNLALENQTSTINISPTDINGTSIVHSLVPLFDNAPIDYTLNASRYGTLFNTTQFQLPINATFDLPIVCPKMNLQVNVIDGSLQPIRNADVHAIEDEGGLFYSNSTSADGTVNLRCTLGRYLVQVYTDGIELNKTTVDVNATNVNATINCQLYGLNVVVRVSDYFGQPIPNLNVTLQRTGYQSSARSGSDGLATFSNIVGGNLRLTVLPVGQSNPFAVTTASVDNSMTIDITLDKYFILAGMLVEMDQFVTVTMIVLIAILMLGLEIYRRRRRSPQKSES